MLFQGGYISHFSNSLSARKKTENVTRKDRNKNRGKQYDVHVVSGIQLFLLKKSISYLKDCHVTKNITRQLGW